MLLPFDAVSTCIQVTARAASRPASRGVILLARKDDRAEGEREWRPQSEEAVSVEPTLAFHFHLSRSGEADDHEDCCADRHTQRGPPDHVEREVGAHVDASEANQCRESPHHHPTSSAKVGVSDRGYPYGDRCVSRHERLARAELVSD